MNKALIRMINRQLFGKQPEIKCLVIAGKGIRISLAREVKPSKVVSRRNYPLIDLSSSK